MVKDDYMEKALQQIQNELKEIKRAEKLIEVEVKKLNAEVKNLTLVVIGSKRDYSMVKKATVKVPKISIPQTREKIFNKNREIIESLNCKKRRPWFCSLFCREKIRY